MNDAVIIVPWRDKGDVWRMRNLDIVKAHLQDLRVAPFLVIGDGREGPAPFNRSAAYNNGVAAFPMAEVFVFYEADMLIPADQLENAIDIAATTPGMVVPFDTYNYLSPSCTELIHRGGVNPADCQAEYVMANGRSNGACNIVSASTMAAVGRWDEAFDGWGYDDRAMAQAFEVATGNTTRYIPGNGIHLYHRPGWSVDSKFRGGADITPVEKAATEANRARFMRYQQARTPEQIRELTSAVWDEV